MKKIIAAALLISYALIGPAFLFASSRIVLLEKSVLWLEGDSTLHRYSSTSTAITAEIETEPPIQDSSNPFWDSLKNKAIKKFTFHVPVATLKSGKSQLDKNMRQSLKAEDYPEIVFQMKEYESHPSLSGGETEIAVKGTLNVAGRSKEIALKARARTDSGITRAVGFYDLLMTDYGVAPPSLMMGAIKTKNEITVHYELWFGLTDTK